MTNKTKILKVGGSVVTFKNRDSALNVKVVKQIAKDISKWIKENPKSNLIFTSGAGSFGHPLAHKYNLHAESAKKDSVGFVLTTVNMQDMANRIAKLFHEFSVPLFPIMPSSVFETDEGRIIHADLNVLSDALNRNLVPFFWGDTVIDKSHTFRILSGDQINPYLVKHLGINELYFGTNVNGIYDSDPNKNSTATKINKINNSNYKSVLNKISGSNELDVTKGMRGKIEEIYQIKVRPLVCVIYNAFAPGNTYNALSGKNVGTQIKFS